MNTQTTPKPTYRTREEWVNANPLRRWRTTHGWSQARVADEIGVQEATIRSYERGRRFPTPTVLETITRITGDREIAARWLEWRAAQEELETVWL